MGYSRHSGWNFCYIDLTLASSKAVNMMCRVIMSIFVSMSNFDSEKKEVRVLWCKEVFIYIYIIICIV